MPKVKTCVMCDAELPTPLDEFGSRENPVCRTHYLEYGTLESAWTDDMVEGLEELLLLPIDQRIASWEKVRADLLEKKEISQAEKEVEELKGDIRDLQREINYAEERLHSLREKKREKEKKADMVAGIPHA